MQTTLAEAPPQRKRKLKIATPRPLEPDGHVEPTVSAPPLVSNNEVWCVAQAKGDVYDAVDGQVIAQADGRNLIFPATASGDWVGIRVIDSESGAITDGFIKRAGLSAFGF